MPVQIWSGEIDGQTYRVIDLGVQVVKADRLEVEIRMPPDLMGGMGWGRFDPIPSAVFSTMLIDAGIVT